MSGGLPAEQFGRTRTHHAGAASREVRIKPEVERAAVMVQAEPPRAEMARSVQAGHIAQGPQQPTARRGRGTGKQKRGKALSPPPPLSGKYHRQHHDLANRQDCRHVSRHPRGDALHECGSARYTGEAGVNWRPATRRPTQEQRMSLSPSRPRTLPNRVASSTQTFPDLCVFKKPQLLSRLTFIAS
jgi:hypothetical protein